MGLHQLLHWTWHVLRGPASWEVWRWRHQRRQLLHRLLQASQHAGWMAALPPAVGQDPGGEELLQGGSQQEVLLQLLHSWTRMS